MNDAIAIIAAEKVLRTTKTEGWEEIVKWMDERIAKCTLKAMNSEENELKYKHEVQTFEMFKKQINLWETMVLEAHKNEHDRRTETGS